MNESNIVNNYWEKVEEEISRIINYSKNKGLIIKIIIETAILNNEQIIKMCEICNKYNVDYII